MNAPDLVSSTYSDPDALLDDLLNSAPTGAGVGYTHAAIKAYGSVEAYEAFKSAHPEYDARQFEQFGLVLQPKQVEFHVWAHRADHEDGPNEIGMGGARGPGKSFGVFSQVALDDCQRYPGIKVLYLRKTGKAAYEQLQDLVWAVLQNVKGYEFKAQRITFANGSRIIFGGFKDDNEAMKYQGLEYDIVVIEETTQLSERTYKAVRLSARSSKMFNGVSFRPRTYSTTNPLGIGHFAYRKRFIDNEKQGRPDHRKKFIFATVDDNKFVDSEYVHNLDDLNGAEYRAYRLGDWNVSAGAYFEEWNEDIHLVPRFEFIPAEWPIYASMDYGYNHWNAIYLHTQDPIEGTIYTFEELCHRKHYPHEIVPDLLGVLRRYNLQLGEISSFVVGNDVFRRTGQAEKTVAELYSDLSISLTPADVTPGSRVSGAHRMAQLLGNKGRAIAPRWKITDNCHRLKDTIPYLERDPNNGEDVLKVDADENGNGGDDAYDAVRYGLVDIVGFMDAPGEMIREDDSTVGAYWNP